MQVAPRIVVDDKIQGGKPVIEGTRVPVAVILGTLAAGDSIELVMEEYRLEREDVLAAIAYAATEAGLDRLRNT